MVVAIIYNKLTFFPEPGLHCHLKNKGNTYIMQLPQSVLYSVNFSSMLISKFQYFPVAILWHLVKSKLSSCGQCKPDPNNFICFVSNVQGKWEQSSHFLSLPFPRSKLPWLVWVKNIIDSTSSTETTGASESQCTDLRIQAASGL